MARRGSQKRAGYYPVAREILPAVAQALGIRRYGNTATRLLDPCAGGGEALGELGTLLGIDETYGVEIEADRARRLRERGVTCAVRADVFEVVWQLGERFEEVGAWADVLWLNPPYDRDPEHGRLEQRFLAHVTPWLRIDGALLFLLPARALAASAEYLDTHYGELRALRVPRSKNRHVPEQILVIARRSEGGKPAGAVPMFERLDPISSLPRLDTVTRHKHWIHVHDSQPIRPLVLELPSAEVRQAFAEWNPVPDGTDRDLESLLHPRFPCATPPRPAHVVLALAAGAFAGRRLVPDEPGYPEILASARVSSLDLEIASTRLDDESRKVKTVEIPRLRISILDLSTRQISEIEPEAEPAGGRDPSKWTAGDLLTIYRRSLMAHLEQAFPILHDRRRPEHRVELPKLRREPFPFQHEAIITALKLMAQGENPPFQAEMGTGKSTLFLVLAASLAPEHRDHTVDQLLAQGFKGARRLPTVEKPLVVCPPHLVTSWRDEIAAVYGEDYPVIELASIRDIERAARHEGPAILLMTREQAKLGHFWKGVEPFDRRHATCPRCGAPVAVSAKTLASQRRRCERCNELLFQAVAKPLPDRPEPIVLERRDGHGPRRYPLSRYLTRRHPGLVDLVALDEAHEYSNGDSAQSLAAQRLGALGVPTILLTGSLVNGYASSLFVLLWMTSRRFREEYAYGETSRFAQRFGYVERQKTVREIRRGECTERRETGITAREAPGIRPDLVLRHVLPRSIVLHKADVEALLPPIEERSAPIHFEPDVEPLDAELRSRYQRLERAIVQAIAHDRTRGHQSRLLGALVQASTYLERATEDLGAFEVRYPVDGDGLGPIVHRVEPLPESYRTPKERHLLALLGEHVEAELPTLVFLQNTGTGLPERLVRLVKEGVTERCAYLDAKRVKTAKRQSWIVDQVEKRRCLVLFVHPRAVATGLNCLTRFCRAVWYQLGHDARIYRQANGRLHRIGQTRPVEVVVPYYAETSQALQFERVAAKVRASLQVDGLDLRAALEAAGGAYADRWVDGTLSIGEALFAELRGRIQPSSRQADTNA